MAGSGRPLSCRDLNGSYRDRPGPARQPLAARRGRTRAWSCGRPGRGCPPAPGTFPGRWSAAAARAVGSRRGTPYVGGAVGARAPRRTGGEVRGRCPANFRGAGRRNRSNRTR
ncbi:hypothetical protein GCM10010519_34020 [Streptomyces lactacystinicus]